MTSREIVAETLQASGWGTLENLESQKWIDCQPDFETSHYTNGFAYSDGKFKFKPDWSDIPIGRKFDWGIADKIPALPDHWDVIENADDAHPFRLATSPARDYLNSSFDETASSRQRHGKPTVLVHPDDLAELGIVTGDMVRLGNKRGEIEIEAKAFDGLQRGVVITESIPPNHQFAGDKGINTLTGADQVAPYGGAAFHDNHVWIAKA